MSNKISEKIKSIRSAEDLTQPEFVERTGIPLGTIKRLEGGSNAPNFEAVQKICTAFPQYTMYLMFDEMPANVGADQITPEEKKLRDLSTSVKTA